MSCGYYRFKPRSTQNVKKKKQQNTNYDRILTVMASPLR